MFFEICFYFNFNFVDRRCHCYCCCCVFAARAARRCRIVKNCVFGKQQQHSRRGNKVREEVYSAAKPKLSCPQTPFGGPLLTQSLWTRRRRSVECVDCGRVCSGDDEAAKAATTQSMRQMQTVYATLDASARIPASFDRHSQREREKETERERWQRICHYVIRIRLTDSWVN